MDEKAIKKIQKAIDRILLEKSDKILELLESEDFQNYYKGLMDIKILIKIKKELITYKWEI